MAALTRLYRQKSTTNSNGTQLKGTDLAISCSVYLLFKVTVKDEDESSTFFCFAILTLFDMESQDFCLIYPCI